MSTIAYDAAMVTRSLGRKTVEKAQSYIGKIRNLVATRNRLTGEVKGNAAEPYVITVYLHQLAGGLSISGQCTCPVTYQCKHAAALLLANLAREAELRDGGVNHELLDWLDGFRQRRSRAAAVPKPAAHCLIYELENNDGDGEQLVGFFKAALNKDGSVKTFEKQWDNVQVALQKPPAFLSDEDILILQSLFAARRPTDYSGYPLRGKAGGELLREIIATGRCVVMTDYSESLKDARWLKLAAGRPAELSWQLLENNTFRSEMVTQPKATAMVMVDPPYYIDVASNEAGVAEHVMPLDQLQDFLSMPVVRKSDFALISAVFRDYAPELPLPDNIEPSTMPLIEDVPQPVLRLQSRTFNDSFYKKIQIFDFAELWFEYAGIRVEAVSAKSFFANAQGKPVKVQRDAKAEKKYSAMLAKTALLKAQQRDIPYMLAATLPKTLYAPQYEHQWLPFIQKNIPELRNKGWNILMDDDFSFNVTEVEEINGSAVLAEDGWFDIEMGIYVNDRMVRLEPLLAALFQSDPRWLGKALNTIPDQEPVLLRTDRNEQVVILAQRLKPLVKNLLDLFARKDSSQLRLSAWDAGRLNDLSDSGRWQFKGQSAVRELALQLKNSQGITLVAKPDGLNADLRSYQQQGLSWMQFLRQHNLSGVLADDMGLGKTVQTLAHIQAEKEAGRLDKPALIVVPTTLVYNWLQEAAKFTPQLTVLALNGGQRKEYFERLRHFDVILTTYALVWRDRQDLEKTDYHLLILDEAQYVKNSRTQAAQAIRALQARHRLCLTGTPLENHLGELWSQFDFLLPGFLGSEKEFTQRWRTPIEKEGDRVRSELLARRIRPFMLRRRKNDVAKELPDKTMIIRSVELEGAQRDLYETVRSAMQEKVRLAIAEQGMARSHIVVLDALLKLRQVCCDPGLVKLDAAGKVKNSAKLEMLLEMVRELIDEGRRILLFSQFTGMLTIIAESLKKAGIPYVTLTGSTTDRNTPVSQFQKGEVAVFLISLKAGGVGLNLTAADTVIHYDPWWNPAAENQATDRAHRLGQDKVVFVYKLIVAGSIEEKIVALQDKKAELVGSILSEDSGETVKFSSEDLTALFEAL